MLLKRKMIIMDEGNIDEEFLYVNVGELGFKNEEESSDQSVEQQCHHKVALVHFLCPIYPNGWGMSLVHDIWCDLPPLVDDWDQTGVYLLIDVQ
ncbi:hypothetical protein L2E82_46086 [Cichorium intybus]|uniref:Uncharacterized protein n=1 Tax=Cichorium intybus TaxID=13427 RepID=A0ACB8YT73_CICIN|nr:hypothetical protein L2E82_46086 [Cichorium intybus]